MDKSLAEYSKKIQNLKETRNAVYQLPPSVPMFLLLIDTTSINNVRSSIYGVKPSRDSFFPYGFLT